MTKAEALANAAKKNPIQKRAEIVEKTTLVLNTMLEAQPTYEYIDIDLIEFNEANSEYRQLDTDESIIGFAEEIKRNGLLHNIVVSKKDNGRYLLISGERRTRAYQYLYKTTKEAQWKQIHAQVREGLDNIDEILLLDAANLQTRGGAGGETRVRKSMLRFIENAKTKFHLNDTEAEQLLSNISSLSSSTIVRNIKIERELIEELKELYNDGKFKKEDAVVYSMLSDEEQSAIAEIFNRTKESAETAQKIKKLVVDKIKANETLTKQEDAIKTASNEADNITEEIKKLNEVLRSSKSVKEKINAEVKIEDYKKKLAQKKKEVKAYSDVLNRSTKKVAPISVHEAVQQFKEEESDYSIDKEKERLINKKISKIKSATKIIEEKRFLEQIKELESSEKEVVTTELIAAKTAIERLLSNIEGY